MVPPERWPYVVADNQLNSGHALKCLFLFLLWVTTQQFPLFGVCPLCKSGAQFHLLCLPLLTALPGGSRPARGHGHDGAAVTDLPGLQWYEDCLQGGH